ncbi:MAG: ROK family protein [Candidatus Vogelbacteria bacterium]|nr:ROK family protein [Candidatus Vogelbacteria bacterium]
MILVLDIGGTKTRLSLSASYPNLGEVIVFDTFKNLENEIREIALRAGSILGGEKPTAIIAGIAGVFDEKRETLLTSPNLREWEGINIKNKFEETFGGRVFLENDATLAGLGEAVIGAGKDNQIVAYITVGTGVGGARIVDGKIDARRFGFEPGHQILDKEGHDLEYYVSGGSVGVRYGISPRDITDRKIWDEVEGWLAIGIHNSILHWSPDVVILGGSMILKEPGISTLNVSIKLGEIMKTFKVVPKIAKASIGEYAGLYGGLVLWDQTCKE